MRNFFREEMLAKLSQPMKQRIADEVLERLEGLTNANVSEHRHGYPSIWCCFLNMVT